MKSRTCWDRCITAMVLLGVGMAGATGRAAWRSLSTFRQPPLGTPADRIDPNTAPWWELALLPGIGPVTAHQIIAFRQEAIRRPDDADENGEGVEKDIVGTDGDSTDGAAERRAFQTAADLLKVRGIGPVTMQRIGRYLEFD